VRCLRDRGSAERLNDVSRGRSRKRQTIGYPRSS
jgi:hypothetical protein